MTPSDTSYREIQLTQGQVALVGATMISAEDFSVQMESHLEHKIARILRSNEYSRRWEAASSSIG